MRRLLPHLFVLVLALGATLAPSAAGTADGARVFVASVDGEIDAPTAEYVGRVISEAEASGARAVVLTLNTPGGQLDSTQKMVEAESNAEGVPVIAYVSPQGAQAASAGTFILMASDVAAMAPQSRTGAATPVTATGGDIPGDLGNKVRSDAVALITGLADAHGRNERWAESAVREGAAIGAEKALDIGVVDLVEPDLRSVLEAADGRRIMPKGITLRTANANLVERPRTFAERFGFSPYLAAVPAVLLALAIAAAALLVWRTARLKISTGREGMIGKVGVVRRSVSGSSGGMVFVHGELWQALPEDPKSSPLEAGTEVEVVGFRRTAIVVRPAGR